MKTWFQDLLSNGSTCTAYAEERDGALKQAMINEAEKIAEKETALEEAVATAGAGGLCRAGTYPKLHAPTLAKAPKIYPKYSKYVSICR